MAIVFSSCGNLFRYQTVAYVQVNVANYVNTRCIAIFLAISKIMWKTISILLRMTLFSTH